MDKFLLNNICYKLDAKPEDILFTQLDWAWSDTNGKLLLNLEKRNITAILIVGFHSSETGTSVAYNILDSKITGKVVYQTNNDVRTKLAFAFYYLTLTGSINFAASKPCQYGVNYLAISKQRP